MKQTININLSGYPFIIDDDAYNLLKDYLDTIRYAFESADDTVELASDIEARIAEIILENQNGCQKIVTIEEISAVIERIGKPSDFIEVEETVTANDGKPEEEIKIEEEKIVPPEMPKSKSRNPFVRKGLFRDPQDSMLGGVCAGLAKYLGIDVTIVRLITILLFFLSASTVAIIYIILWIVVPEARTPLQRMKMMGEETSVENIGKTVTGNYQGSDSGNISGQKGNNGVLSTIFSIFVKCIVILGLIIAVPLIVALGIGLLGCIIAVFVLGVIIVGDAASPLNVFSSPTEEIFAFYILLAVIGGIITIGIPLWLMLRMYWKGKDYNHSRQSRRAILIVWLCGIALVAIFAVKAVKTGKLLTYDRINNNIEQIEDIDIDKENIENIEINPSGITITEKNGKIVTINPGNISVEVSESAEETITDSVATAESEDSIAMPDPM